MAAGNSIASGLAGRYASALFELAKDADQLDAIQQDLNDLKAMIAESDDLAELVRSPLFSREDQVRAMDAVLEAAGASGLTRRFVGTVAQNRRLFALSDMIEAYAELLAEHRGVVRAEVTSAHALDESQLSALSDVLSKALRQDINLESRVDDSLLGGLRVRVGSRLIDSSLRTKLDNLQLAMKGVG